MTDLGSLIKYYRYHFYKNIGSTTPPSPCKYYAGNDQCDREDGCFCRKLAEVRGHIDYVIPLEYRDVDIESATGFIKDKEGKPQRVWSSENMSLIKSKLKDYIFGNNDISKAISRDDYNKASKLDTRYADGDNLIIHGEILRAKKEGLPSQPIPTGKTLISCIVLKEAIWRRMYITNRADTYALVSYQTLKQDLKLKTDKSFNLKECDWLVIDDINLPLHDNDFAHQNFLSLFDDFLMTRMEAKLPTILVCEFDALARDYTNILGYSFQKMVTARGTWLIEVGGK